MVPQSSRSWLLAAGAAALLSLAAPAAGASDPPPSKPKQAAHQAATPPSKTTQAVPSDTHAPAAQAGHGAAALPPRPADPPAKAHAPAAAAKPPSRASLKAAEAETIAVVRRIEEAMAQEAAKSAKPAAAGAAHPLPPRPRPAPPKTRPKPLLLWDAALKPGNVTLVWGPDIAAEVKPPLAAGVRLAWPADGKEERRP
jgi:hypothetical protein